MNLKKLIPDFDFKTVLLITFFMLFIVTPGYFTTMTVIENMSNKKKIKSNKKKQLKPNKM